MARTWATLGVDLHLEPTGPGVRRGLTDALREAVRTGRLAPGTRLPSSRSLAADLGIARNTVADAYADLVAEGWLTARQGSGTRVADRAVTPEQPPAARPPRRRTRPLHDLTPGAPDLASFPRGEWLKAARRALATAPHHALGYGDPRGRPELRTALAGYLARVRGVRADPEHILICAGFSHGLRILAEVLRSRGASTVAVESYGLDVHRDLLSAAGLRTCPLPLDERGTDTTRMPQAAAVLLTPAHQFPMGMPLHPERRAAVTDWARRTGGLVLEDDYDGEFRYDRQPVGALQGLDPDHVVYLGTASKALAPGLRLAWMVLPPSLAEEAAAAKGGSETCGVLDQLTLAEFLTSGAYDRHVRSARLRYRRRRDALVDALATRAPGIHPTGIAAGLHAVLRLPPGTEAAVVQAAAWQGLAVFGLSRFRHERATVPPLDALVVGYGTPPDHAWSAALDALCRVLP
ncbi:MocR-like pyridoxine biosynthesis transcription factor PdxR [Streptomyces mexicanus]|jgi:GntR family transcriptional regulator/MocR family aminotransferase|uniref:MocR-like pyridoxine biosynthesis transcription factor PdxR n=1 Tax=Streptomyces mexicanus TaxID=178566 RepID=UPI00366596A9